MRRLTRLAIAVAVLLTTTAHAGTYTDTKPFRVDVKTATGHFTSDGETATKHETPTLLFSETEA